MGRSLTDQSVTIYTKFLKMQAMIVDGCIRVALIGGDGINEASD
jgi:hypothetical protein